MKHLKNIALIVAVALSSIVYGQGAQAEIEVVLATYNSLDRFSVDVEYKAYKTHTSKEYVDQSVAEYRKDGNKLRTKNMGMEYIQDEKHSIVIDNNNKLVLLGESQVIPEGIFGVENTLSNFYKVEKTGETAATTSYRISFKEGVSEFHESLLVVYKATKLIKRVILYYATDYAVNTEGKPTIKKPKVSISYKNYQTGSAFKFKENEFNISKYFASMGGNKKLKEKYSGYEFYDKTIK